MKISVQSSVPGSMKADVLVVGLFAPAEKAEKKGKAKKKKKAAAQLPAEIADLDKALEGALWSEAQYERFAGGAGEVVSLATHGRLPYRKVVLIGLGPVGEATPDTYRIFGGRALTRVGDRADKAVLKLPGSEAVSPELAAEAAAEGALLAAYRFDRYLTQATDKPALGEVRVVHPELPRDGKAVQKRAQAIVDGVCLARDLVNEPPRTLTPQQFAEEAKKVGEKVGLTVQVFTEKELKREKMGLMLAVAQASVPYTPPRMVRISYRPKNTKAKKHISLVGKGVTFDSGGLDIKPAAGMLDMKIDMGGAAAVLGAMMAIGQLKPDVAVTGYLGCVENGIGGNAYHPSDVITSRKGLTVEVNNTDAEGRLVMADCIDYAIEKDKPDVLIDVATLTGACLVALGPFTAGLFTDDDELAADIKMSGERAGEDFWRLPLNHDLDYQLKSAVADTKNTGERFGGAITAGLFLDQFVAGRARWAHIDIAGPCTMERDHPYIPRGGAGFAVRTLAGLIAPR